MLQIQHSYATAHYYLHFRATVRRLYSLLSGVQQSFILGPTLNSECINDLDVGIKNWILKYADDTR